MLNHRFFKKIAASIALAVIFVGIVEAGPSSIIFDRYAGWIHALLVGLVLMAFGLFNIARLNEKIGISDRMLRAEVDKRKAAESMARKSESRLGEALKNANAAIETKNQFLSNMNHEIRTPMNGIIGMTGLLLGTRMTEEQIDYANTVKSSAQSLLRIIDDMLDYSKIEAGKIDLETIDFELPAMIEDVAVAVSAKAKEKKLKFTHVLDADVPIHVSGDVNRLFQILHHLISNAVKFTPSGEVHVHISLQKEEASQAIVRFCVKDTGIGLDPQRVDRLFSSFTQSEVSDTRKYGGTGLGLAISKHLIQRMGGDISVISTPGKGSTFWFTIKLIKQTTISKRTPFITNDFSDKRILIVDDNATNRRVIKGYLNSWEMRFACADGAPNALAMLHQAVKAEDPFHLAIVDHPMPNMSGEDLGRAVQEDPLLQNLKMVMLTTSGDRKEAKRSTAAGFCAYLTKPIFIDGFFKCLSLIFGKPADHLPSIQRQQPLITKQTVIATEQHSPRILVVEDNMINQKVAQKILSKHGCTSLVVNNGREALEELQHNAYDAVLMDLQMPEMDGYEATIGIRKPANKCLNPKIPIIALTANAQPTVRDKCLDIGMDDFLSKPVNPEMLIEKIRYWIDKNRVIRLSKGKYSN